MDSINLVITSELDEEYKQKINEISPEIKLTDASDLNLAEQDGDLMAKEELDTILSQAEIVYGLRLPQNIISRAPVLKWIQVRSAGVDRFLADKEIVSS